MAVHAHVTVRDSAIELPALLELLRVDAAGGQCLFVGTVRDHNHGEAVLHLEYEAYAPMAVAMMEKLTNHLAEKYELLRVVMVHRVGLLRIGDIAVVVGVSAAHRDEAFSACREGIDRLKLEIPIWKKEYFVGGSRWVDNCEGCAAGAEAYAEHLHAHPEHEPVKSVERAGKLVF